MMRRAVGGSSIVEQDDVGLESSRMPMEALYEIQGDVAAALDACCSGEDSQSARQQYNRIILSSAISDKESSEDILKRMEEWKKEDDREPQTNISARKQLQKQLILAYNESLVHFTIGRAKAASVQLLDRLRPFVAEKESPHDDLVDVLVRMMLLLLECILTLSEGCHDGICEMDEEVTVKYILRWTDSIDFETRPQLRFLLNLYKSRIDFMARDDSGKLVDSKVRSVRKELRSAMETLNHKMRPAATGSIGGETASVGSNSDVVFAEDQQRAPYSSSSSAVQFVPPGVGNQHQEALVQSYNQSALSLKAHFEQVKGNAKKSLVLCSEARSAFEYPSYEAIHHNNLAVVYTTCDKPHLALHVATKAIASPETSSLSSSGMAQTRHKWVILHNSALCALRAGDYRSGYECMAACVRNSEIYFRRARSWLRLAEACIGIHIQKKKEPTPQNDLYIVDDSGEPLGVVVGSSSIPRKIQDRDEPKKSSLGRPEDLDQVMENPLQRALMCLLRAVKLSEGSDMDCHSAAMCSLAYVKLELCDFQGALDTALPYLVQDDCYWDDSDSTLRRRILKRQLAAMRLYASEALYALGKHEDAMGTLSARPKGEQYNDFLNIHALAMAGIQASDQVKDEKEKQRLSKFQAITQMNAGAILAAMGKTVWAKELAVKALKSIKEKSILSPDNEIVNVSRRNVIHCALGEGDKEETLQLLHF